jgi:hypothetical protein
VLDRAKSTVAKKSTICDWCYATSLDTLRPLRRSNASDTEHCLGVPWTIRYLSAAEMRAFDFQCCVWKGASLGTDLPG